MSKHDISSASDAADPPAEIEASALARLDQDIGAEGLREVAQAALADNPNLCRELEQALAARDAERLRMAAHTLKSTTRLLGASSLAELLGRIESGAAQGRLDAAAVTRALRRHERFVVELHAHPLMPPPPP